MAGANTSDSADDSNAMTEWSQCRTEIDKYDDRLDGVRKLGFTFITALFTANSLLGQIIGNYSGLLLTNGVKLAVFGAILFLIVGMRFMDSFYRTYEESISMRARVLEVRLNLELTETVSERHGSIKPGWFIDGLYYVLCLAVLLIGSVSLTPSATTLQALEATYSVHLLFYFTIATMAIVTLIGAVVRPKDNWKDWTIDRVACRTGDSVRIVLTNLGKKRFEYEDGESAWTIQNETEPEMRPDTGKHEWEGHFRQKGTLHKGDSYDWLWLTKGYPPGIYKIILAGSEQTLHRKVRITE